MMTVLSLSAALFLLLPRWEDFNALTLTCKCVNIFNATYNQTSGIGIVL